MQETVKVPRLRDRRVPADAIERVEPIIGSVAIAWAFFDQAIEFWIVTVYEQALKQNLTNKDPPLGLEDRIKLLKKCFVRMPQLAVLRDEAVPVLITAADLADKRHMIVHGTLSHYLSEPEDAFVFVKLRYSTKESFHVVEQRAFAFGEMRQMATDTNAATLKLQELLKRVDRVFDD